ncbi:MAG: cation:proton antiporter, partial [Proteobacteria bacterium]|nr:cation:proton antiporter [Pseudomonadota bacterium]
MAETHAADLSALATVALAALLCGLAFRRFGQPAIVGYIAAGLALGPAGFGVVLDRAAIGGLAELGVLLLLFVVGMELSVRTFRRLWHVYVSVTVLQAAVGTGVLLLLARLFDWPFGLALLMGFMVALSSTAVAIKMLDDLGLSRSRVGRVTVGVLIAQDLAVVPMILAVRAVGGGGWGWDGGTKIAIAILLLVGLVFVLGRGRRISLPFAEMGRQRELAPVLALAFCFGAAALTGLAGLSAAYGAFLAGIVIGNSRERHALLDVTRPLESVLVMVFFVSIGLLVDVGYILDNAGLVLLLFLLVAMFKTVLNATLLRLFGQPWPKAFMAAILLAQVGEFSFLLAGTGMAAGVIGEEGQRLIVAVTVLSLALSPLWVLTARRIRHLASQGITSASQVLRLVYAPEATRMSGTLGWLAIVLARGAARTGR